MRLVAPAVVLALPATYNGTPPVRSMAISSMTVARSPTPPTPANFSTAEDLAATVTAAVV